MAEPSRAALSYRNHTEAAIAAALLFNPDLVGPSVTDRVVTFTSQTGVDLRVQVQGDDGSCEWFGVNADITETGLRWHSAHAASCNN